MSIFNKINLFLKKIRIKAATYRMKIGKTSCLPYLNNLKTNKIFIILILKKI